ncbi:MAG: hypothetical protein C4525_13460 [Desulfarculus sp.]|jgi:hypothetical protein|nr:MAG: hypothetical protein C4525_13460 [Desulfarculus sp.]
MAKVIIVIEDGAEMVEVSTSFTPELPEELTPEEVEALTPAQMLALQLLGSLDEDEFLEEEDEDEPAPQPKA